MEIEQKLVGEIAVLVLSGKIDAITSKGLESVLNDLLDQGHSQVVIDLRDVDFISSGGLRVLIAFKKRLAGCSGDLVVSSLQPSVTEIFEMTGLPGLICTYPGSAEAVKGLRSKSA